MSNLTKCYQCKHEYDPRDSNTVLPDNMHIQGVGPHEKLPQCPECDTVDFMDIAARQLANDPRFEEEEVDGG